MLWTKPRAIGSTAAVNTTGTEWDTLQGLHAWRCIGDDNVRCQSDQFPRVLSDDVSIRTRTIVDVEIFALGPAQSGQSRLEHVDAAFRLRVASAEVHQNAHPAHPLGLRIRDGRPCRQRATQ